MASDKNKLEAKDNITIENGKLYKQYRIILTLLQLPWHLMILQSDKIPIWYSNFDIFCIQLQSVAVYINGW